MKVKFAKPESMQAVQMHYCPGCGHGIVHRLIAEVVDELGVRERTVGIAPVGCAVTAYNYFNFDVSEAAHGRTPCVATGIKRVHPENVVFTYQGDGDLAAIGTAEIIHTANRAERITVIFVNNGVYGMTGGQMAPTTLVEQKTTTTRRGRDPLLAGYPMKICEMLAVTPGSVFIVRCAVNTPKNVIAAKRAIKKAFEVQIKNLGFSLVEILSTCPVNWHLTPSQSLKYITETVMKEYPLGVIKDTSGLP
jgi:2-oxoglutarate ferredoxin oxidoreductase subunit beta